ncbi:MAG TPA: DUF1292 domain-containing protein [Clostridia bacterium]|nr:DUF1292 domain-containing protein [Clostridia bacterium]
MTEERDDIVVLIDENGEEVEFEHLDTIEMNGKEYVVLLPVDGDNEDPEADEVIILKLEHGSEEEDSFITIDDEDELNAVFEEFKQRLEEEYDEEE